MLFKAFSNRTQIMLFRSPCQPPRLPSTNGPISQHRHRHRVSPALDADPEVRWRNCGSPSKQFWISIQIGAPRRNVRPDLAAKSPPDNQGNNGVSTPHLLVRRHGRARSSAVLSIRLAQEKPKYYEAYLRGDYKSVTAAATDAGLLKDNSNMRRGKSAFRKMSEPERKQFLQWIRRWTRQEKK